MARDDDDDLYDEEFDFVDDELDEDDGSDVEDSSVVDEEEEPASAPKKPRKKVAKKSPPARETKKKAARAPRARKAAPADDEPAKPAARKKTAAAPIPPKAWDLAEPEAPPRGEFTPDDEFDDPDTGLEEAADVQGGEPLDEFGRPLPVANYVVHIYEHQRHKRTIDRDFTPEDAEAFATEYSRTGKPYGRSALAGKKDTEPKKRLAEKTENTPTALG